MNSQSVNRNSAATQILAGLGTRLLIHHSSYSLLNRWIETGLLDVLEETGVGCIAFPPLAQGLLTDRYLTGIPAGSRASRDGSLSTKMLSEETLAKVRGLNAIARDRGQTLAHMALAWTLRDRRVTSALIAASSVDQLEENPRSLEKTNFSTDELAAIDRFAIDSNINIWTERSPAE